MRTAVAAPLVLALAFLACKKYEEPKIGEARLAYADGVRDVPNSRHTVVVLPNQPYELPDTDQLIRVAIDWDVPFGDVWPLVELVAAGQRPIVLLVADDRGRVKQMDVGQPTTSSHIRMVVTADGKACVNLPGVEEAKCVMTPQHRVDRAWSRDLVREALEASDLRRVNVEIEPALRWNDAVRAIDAAQTCCQGEVMQVGVALY